MVSTRQRRDVNPTATPADDNILLVQSIQITDKFGFQADDASDLASSLNSADPHEKAYAGVAQDKLTCLNGYGKFQFHSQYLYQFQFPLCENVQSRAHQGKLLNSVVTAFNKFKQQISSAKLVAQNAAKIYNISVALLYFIFVY